MRALMRNELVRLLLMLAYFAALAAAGMTAEVFVLVMGALVGGIVWHNDNFECKRKS
jgi:hypothetical protein